MNETTDGFFIVDATNGKALVKSLSRYCGRHNTPYKHQRCLDLRMYASPTGYVPQQYRKG